MASLVGAALWAEGGTGWVPAICQILASGVAGSWQSLDLNSTANCVQHPPWFVVLKLGLVGNMFGCYNLGRCAVWYVGMGFTLLLYLIKMQTLRESVTVAVPFSSHSILHQVRTWWVSVITILSF